MLYVWLGVGGRCDVELDLEVHPPDEEALTEALAGIQAASVTCQDYGWDHEEDLWYAYLEFRRLDRFDGFAAIHHLALDRLRAPLREAGHRTLEVSLMTPPAPWTACAPKPDKAEAERHGTWHFYTLDAQKPLPELRVTHGYTARDAALRASVFLLWLAPLLLVFWGVRCWALRYPEPYQGDAVYAFMRFLGLYVWGVMVSGFVLVHATAPLAFLAYTRNWSFLAASWGSAMLFGLFAALLLIALLLAGFGVLKRLPNMRLTHIEFLRVNGAVVATPLLMGGAWVGIALSGGEAAGPAGLAWLILMFYALFWLFRTALSAMPGDLRTLYSGALRASMLRQAASMGVSGFEQVLLHTSAKLPGVNAFVTRANTIVLTERLVRLLTRREVDAIAAHELAHLRWKHPRYRLWLALLIPVLLAAILAVFLHVDIPDPAWFIEALAVMIILGGLLLYAKVQHKQELIADADAAQWTDDAEAVVTALAKLTRANLLSPQPKGLARWLLSHPPLRKRAAAIAEAGNTPFAELWDLVETGAGTGERKYPIPGSQGERLFNCRWRNPVALSESFHKTFGLGFNVLLVFCIGAMAAGIVQEPNLLYVWLPCLFGVFTMPLHLLLPLIGKPMQLESRVRAKLLRGGGSGNGRFVAFRPSPAREGFDGSLYLDVGLLETAPGALVFHGDTFTFALPRTAIEAIGRVKIPLGFVPGYEIAVRWRPPGADAAREFRFGLAAGKRSEELEDILRTWFLSDSSGEPSEPLPSEEVMEASGKPMRKHVARPQVVLRLTGVTIVALCLGTVLGLPAHPERFAHFVAAILATKALEVAGELRFVFGKDRPVHAHHR